MMKKQSTYFPSDTQKEMLSLAQPNQSQLEALLTTENFLVVREAVTKKSFSSSLATGLQTKITKTTIASMFSGKNVDFIGSMKDIVDAHPAEQRAEVAERAVTLAENMTPDIAAKSFHVMRTPAAQLRDPNTISTLNPSKNKADPKYVRITARYFEHFLSAGSTPFAVACRDHMMNVRNAVVAQLMARVNYETARITNHRERTDKHQQFQSNILATDVVPRDDGKERKAASAIAASSYHAFYGAAIGTKRPRTALEKVDISLKKKPVIEQATPVGMAYSALFIAKVQQYVTQRRNANNPITYAEAAKIIGARIKAADAFREQDIDGNNYSDDDQKRALFDANFAAHGVRTTSIVIRRA